MAARRAAAGGARRIPAAYSAAFEAGDDQRMGSNASGSRGRCDGGLGLDLGLSWLLRIPARVVSLFWNGVSLSDFASISPLIGIFWAVMLGIYFLTTDYYFYDYSLSSCLVLTLKTPIQKLVEFWVTFIASIVWRG